MSATVDVDECFLDAESTDKFKVFHEVFHRRASSFADTSGEEKSSASMFDAWPADAIVATSGPKGRGDFCCYLVVHNTAKKRKCYCDGYNQEPKLFWRDRSGPRMAGIRFLCMCPSPTTLLLSRGRVRFRQETVKAAEPYSQTRLPSLGMTTRPRRTFFVLRSSNAL